MRAYELIYILDPALTEEQLTEQVQRFAQLAKDQGAEVDEPKRWPRRRLAYRIKNRGEGFYVVMTMRAEPAHVTEITRVLKLAEQVLRHMVVAVETPPPPVEAEAANVQ